IKGDTICEFDFGEKYTEGYDWTWQAPRADFDFALTEELKRKGVDIAFNHEVISVDFNDDGSSKTIVKADNNETFEVRAKFIIDSSGYGRVLPRILNLDKPSSIPEHSSIFSHVKEPNRPEGTEGTF